MSDTKTLVERLRAPWRRAMTLEQMSDGTVRDPIKHEAADRITDLETRLASATHRLNEHSCAAGVDACCCPCLQAAMDAQKRRDARDELERNLDGLRSNSGARIWAMLVPLWTLRFVRAAAPCWKGEVQIGPMVIGWQARARVAA